MKKYTMFVDADACPVKEEIRQIVKSYDCRLIFVASYASFSTDAQAEWVFVDQKKEEADLYIVNHVKTGDVVITQDMGLAGLLTGRGVYVLSNRGREISDQEISGILHDRYLSYKSLAAGQKVKGPKPFRDEERKKFSNALTKLLCRLDH